MLSQCEGPSPKWMYVMRLEMIENKVSKQQLNEVIVIDLITYVL